MALINLLEKYYDPDFQINFHNIEKKLNGEIPVTRLELIELINSWGRNKSFQTSISNYNRIQIKACEPKECYNLSKLDTSQITDMTQLFAYSMFNDIHSANGIGLHNGDISKWNTSKVTDMSEMFYYAKNFNQNLNSWNVSNVTNMSLMFSNTEEFNQPLNNWDVSNVINIFHIFGKTKKFNQDISNWDLNDMVYFEDAFYKAEAFLNKYNNGEILPNNSNELKEWFNENREKIKLINIKDQHGKEIDNFFSNITNLTQEINKDIKWH